MKPGCLDLTPNPPKPQDGRDFVFYHVLLVLYHLRIGLLKWFLQHCFFVGGIP